MIELLTNDEMGEADRRTIASGIPGTDLMEHAGAAVARPSPGVIRPARVAMVAGPGKWRRWIRRGAPLAAAGYRIRLRLIGVPDSLKGDAPGRLADGAARSRRQRPRRRRCHHRCLVRPGPPSRD
jgi:hypothetical protein